MFAKEMYKDTTFREHVTNVALSFEQLLNSLLKVLPTYV